ncbi:MAG: erythromycin esterase family protein [Planctomycetota bacterium]|jgi:erythromycin esterase-like protein
MDFSEIRTVDPESGHEDLRPLLDMVGAARVVGLGECGQGSSEIHRLKHRIVEILAEELSFSRVVLEANLAETIRVNEYVLEGRWDPADLLPRHLYSGVCTEEIAAMLRWMWAFNAAGRGRIALAGCDMQRIDTATEIVKEHLRTIDPGLADSVTKRYQRVLEADRVRWLSGKGIQAWFPVEEAKGRRLRFSASIRTENVSDHACIWGWAGGAEGTLAHDALEGRRPRGTTGWREYSIDLDVPEKAVHVSLGCFLAGNGRAWFDGLSIEIEGEQWRDPERIDLDFSSPDLKGFWVDPRNRAALDADMTRTGRPSLRIEPAGPVRGFEPGDVEALTLAKQVLAELTERLSPDESAKALRCARAVVQALEMRAGGGDAARARSMAENIEWLLARDPETKVIFWTQNGQVAKRGGDTGTFLAESLGEQYVSIGFATGWGECLATAPRRRDGLHPHSLLPPPGESIERLMLGAGSPRMLMDLRTAEAADPKWGWLLERRPFRTAGASALPYEFSERRIQEDFDLLFWIERTTAARPLAGRP